MLLLAFVLKGEIIVKLERKKCISDLIAQDVSNRVGDFVYGVY